MQAGPDHEICFSAGLAGAGCDDGTGDVFCRVCFHVGSAHDWGWVCGSGGGAGCWLARGDGGWRRGMKIAYVYDAVYPWIKGGAEKRVYEISRRLVERGHEVHWFGLKWGDGVVMRGENKDEGFMEFSNQTMLGELYREFMLMNVV